MSLAASNQASAPNYLDIFGFFLIIWKVKVIRKGRVNAYKVSVNLNFTIHTSKRFKNSIDT